MSDEHKSNEAAIAVARTAWSLLLGEMYAHRVVDLSRLDMKLKAAQQMLLREGRSDLAEEFDSYIHSVDRLFGKPQQ